MSNPDYLQSLRDLAQAEQMRSAAESARNLGKLLEAQERQAELEEQKLKIEQLRLQEERNSRIASATKSETHRAIRVAMTAVEEEIDLLLKRATSGQKQHLVDGLPAVSFFSLLVKKKLKRVILSQSKLEDLGDIRFARSLERRFEELKELHPHYFGEAILQRTRKVFMEVAFWAHETKCFNNQDDSLHEFLQKSGARIDLIALKIDNTLLSTAMIEEFIESIQELKQKTLIAKDKITEAWNIRERQASRLRSCGFGDAEIEFTADAKLDPNANELLNQIHNHQSRIEQLKASLLEAKADWVHDRDLFESASDSLREAKFGEAEKASKQFRRTWSDLYVRGINKALTQKRDSLVQEVDALSSDKTAAINLAQKLAVEYSSSTTISDALKNYQIKLMGELVEQRDKRRRNITLVILLLCGSMAGGVWVFNSIARIQRERAIEAERTSKAVAAGRILLDDEGRSLLLIPIGSFEMGSNQEAHEKPLRTVNVGAFFMGETEVTYQEWKTVLAWSKSKGYEFKNEGKGSGEKHPVTNVNWYDVVKWCNAKSEKEGLAPCYKVSGTIYRQGEEDSVSCDWRLNSYRLPTEAEWEKAARGGLIGNRYPNSDSLVVGSANFSWNGTREVGLYARNNYGLRDMAGNVWEWCWDWYKSGYETGTSKDPIGPNAGSVRVLRGGGWNSSANLCRVSYRNTSNPKDSYGSYGLRLVRNLDPSASEKRVEQP